MLMTAKSTGGNDQVNFGASLFLSAENVNELIVANAIKSHSVSYIQI